MKLNRRAWKALRLLARQEGYKGDGDRAEVLKYLTTEADIGKVTFSDLGLKDVELKRLEVELSEDSTQVLVTQVPDTEQEDDPDEDDPDKQDDPDDEDDPNKRSYDPAELTTKIAAGVDAELKRRGVTPNGRPRVGDTDVRVGQSAEEAHYQRKIDRGQANISSPFMAKLFALNLCRSLAGQGVKLGHGADTPDVAFKLHDGEYKKMMGSDHPKAVSLRRQIKTYSVQQQKALSSATSNLTGIEFSSELIRLVEEYGVAPRLTGITQMTEMQKEVKRRLTGITIAYPAENVAATESSPTYDAIMLTAKEGVGLSKVSRMALRSATIDLADEVMGEHGHAWAQHIDDAYFKGDGTSTYASRIGMSHVTGAGAPFGTSAATDTGFVVVGAGTGILHTAAQLAKMIGRLPDYAKRRGNAVITGLPDFLANTFQRLAAAQGGTTMMEFQGVMVNQYAGIPLIGNYSMSNTTLDSSGDTIDFMYGDFAQATKIGYFGPLEIEPSDQVYWDQNSIGIRSTLAWDFVIHDVGDISTAGPVVSFWQT